MIFEFAMHRNAGPLPVELFLPKFQQGDRFEVAARSGAKPGQ